MRLLSVHASCPPELVEALSSCSALSECLEVVRPLAYHAECLVTLQHFKALGLKVAVKSYTKHRLGRLAREQVDTEAHIHASLEHESIVPLLVSAEDERCLHLVVRWAEGGDLRGHLSTAPPLSEQRVREFVVRPLLHALAVLEAKGVVHRDVKPDNVLVEHGQVQLADFGLAVYHHRQDELSSGCSVEEGSAASADEEHHHHRDIPAGAASCESSLPVSMHSSCSMLDGLSAMADEAQHHHQPANGESQLHHHLSAPGPAERLGLQHAATAPAPIPMARSVSSQQQTVSTLPRPASGALPTASSMPSSKELMSSAGGTPLYTAPEVLKCMFESGAVDQVVTPKNDVWSLGIMVLEALSGTHPFSRSSNALHAIASHKSFSSFPAHLSPAATAWLHAALHANPTLRQSATQLLAHPWMQHTTSVAGAGSCGGCPTTPKLHQQGGSAAAAHLDASCLKASGGGAAAAGLSSAGGASGALVAQGCKVQMQREREVGSMGGASPTAASGAAFFSSCDAWEY